MPEIKHNSKKSGIELTFASKPDFATLQWLKDNKYRWSNFNMVWWKKFSLDSWRAVHAYFDIPVLAINEPVQAGSDLISEEKPSTMKQITMYYKVTTESIPEYLAFLKEIKPYIQRGKVFSAGIGTEYMILTGGYDKQAAMHPSVSVTDFDSIISDSKNIRYYSRLNRKPVPEKKWKGKWVSIDERIKHIENVLADDDLEPEKSPGTVFSEVIKGREIEISMPNGEKRKAYFAITELDYIIASHNEENFHSEPDYPKNASGNNINDRNYKDDLSAQKAVMDYARELEPERLITTSRTPSGTPIITKDGFVVSGNNRTMSLKLAAKNYPANYKEYVDFLAEEINSFGFESATIITDGIAVTDKDNRTKHFKNPVLVRIDLDFPEYTTQELAKYNKDTKKSERPVDKAIKLSNILRENSRCAEIIAEITGEYETFTEFYGNIVGQKKLAKTLVECNLLTEQEMPAYFSDTAFTETGKEFIENLLAALVLDREALMATEQPGVKGIRQKLITSLPVLMKNATLPEGSLRGHINDAVIFQQIMKASGSEFTDFIRQANLYGTKYNRKTVYLNRLINQGKLVFKSCMEKYNASIIINQAPALFGEKPTVDDIFNQYIKKYVDSTEQRLIEKSELVSREEVGMSGTKPEEKALVPDSEAKESLQMTEDEYVEDQIKHHGRSGRFSEQIRKEYREKFKQNTPIDQARIAKENTDNIHTEFLRFTDDEDSNDRFKIYLVDGNEVRKDHIEFTMGGHGYVYDYIPKDEIWIDENLKDKPEDLEATIKHEVFEVRKMRDEGLDYESAHELANDMEKEVRNDEPDDKEPEEDIAEVRLKRLMLLRKFISVSQHEALSELMMGEEGEAGWEIIDRIGGIIETMPKTYETEDIRSADKIVYLHYFRGGSDFYIVEKDKEPVQHQAFGYSILNGDTVMAEWGYISIVELIQNDIELDFYWTPKKFSEVIDKQEKTEQPEPDVIISSELAESGPNVNMPGLDDSEKVRYESYDDFMTAYSKAHKSPFTMVDIFLGGRDKVKADILRGRYTIDDLKHFFNEAVNTGLPEFYLNDAKNVAWVEEQVVKGFVKPELKELVEPSEPVKSRSEFLNKLHELDLWQEFDGRHYRKFILHPGNERAVTDLGIKERMQDVKVGGKDYVSAIISIPSINSSLEEEIEKAYQENTGTEVTLNKPSDDPEIPESVSKPDESVSKPDETVSKPDISVTISDYKNEFDLNKAIEALLDSKWNDKADTWSTDQLVFIKGYTGYGGLDDESMKAGVKLDVKSLFEYFTPDQVIEKMWGLAYKYGYKDGTVLEPSCFVKGTKIITEQGISNIEDIKTGDFVYTHTNKFKKVIKTHNNSSSEIIQIQIPTDYDIITTTPNHPFYAIKTKIHNKKDNRPCHIGHRTPTKECLKHWTEYKPEWIKASNLSIGDYLIDVFDKTIIDQKEIKLYEIAHFNNKCPQIIKISSSFLKIIGLYIGNGTRDKNATLFIINKKDSEVINLLSDYFSSLGLKVSKTIRDHSPNVVCIKVNSVSISDFFQQFGHKAPNKFIPDWLLKLPYEKQKDLLWGLLKTDGHIDVKNDYFSYSTSSINLAHNIKSLLYRLEAIPSFRMQNKKQKVQLLNGRFINSVYPSYSLYVTGSKYKDLMLELFRVKIREKKTLNKTGIIIENFAYIKVHAIKKQKSFIQTYNLTVEDDNSYSLLGCMVHNCGIGPFFDRRFVSNTIEKHGYEINKYSAKICKLLYPEAIINDGEEIKYFEQLFIRNNNTVGSKVTPRYRLVIGNPPYGAVGGYFMGMGETRYTHAKNFIDYFILRGLDLLEKGGLLIYIIGAETAGGGVPFLDQNMNKAKEMINQRGKLIDAYRLPSGVFARTDVTSDIVVFRKR